MSRSVVLLRGVNVGTSARIAMPDLRRLLEDLGGTDVRTYVQSGNAVLDAPLAGAGLEQAVRGALRDGLGLDVPVMVRTAAELATVVAGLPWQGLDPKLLHVGFLSGEPDTSRIDPAALLPERIEVRGREAYLDFAAACSAAGSPG